MIDPMANIDPAAAGPEMMDAGGAAADGNQEVFDADAYRSNFRKMDKIRSFMGIASGCVAGVCGLTGLGGLGELRAVNCTWFELVGFTTHVYFGVFRFIVTVEL